MTPREIPRAELHGALPNLLHEVSTVVITPISDDLPWAVEAAWDIARAATRSDRRVALVDLSLQRPALASCTSGPQREGIVDAFLFGASMNHVAEEQDLPGLYFIPVGTPPPHPDQVWHNDRWQRLARGFSSQGAILLLYTPRAALERLPITPQLVMVLADRRDPGSRESVDGVSETVFVVPDERHPVAEPEPVAPQRRTGRPRRDKHPPRVPFAAAAALVFGGLAVFAAFRLVLAGPGEALHMSRPTPRGVTTTAAVARGGPASDSLYYSVQVASFTSSAQALEAAARYDALNLTPTVSPVRLGGRGLWYRLIVGAYTDPLAAETALHTIWDKRLLTRASGTILRTPQALDVGGHPTVAAARARLPALRERGVAGYIVEAPDGEFRILVGAFESPEQAGTADSILAAAGLSSLLVTRTGIVR